MDILLTLPFLIQAIVIIVDEWVFHLKRGLPRWERIGHPLDTLTVLICLSFVLFAPLNPTTFKIYLFLALFSCVFVTKDEFIHKECCPASEQWLHAILFLNHPVLLTAAGLMWPSLHAPESSWVLKWSNQPVFFKLFLQTQFVFVSFFMFYQAIYWNFLRQEDKK